jgi:lipooligosaccharide transport system ATP-binding protein
VSGAWTPLPADPHDPPPIEARGLTKRYGSLVAVDGIDLEVSSGECVGLLGPNGAGKTTTVRMITCFTPISGGTARVFGLDVVSEPRAVKALLGICPQENNLDPDFSVRRNLLVFGRYYDLPRAEIERRADALLDMMQLADKARAAIDELSGGMRRRLVLARSMINRPRLLVLDEPTTGLDPQARHLIWDRVQALQAAGLTVLITTHYMEEASRLCDRVVLMDGGAILLEGAPTELIRREVGREVVELWELEEGLRQFIDDAGWPVEEAGSRLLVYDPDGREVSTAIAARFPGQQHLLRHATLEDVFLRRAGRTLRE